MSSILPSTSLPPHISPQNLNNNRNPNPSPHSSHMSDADQSLGSFSSAAADLSPTAGAQADTAVVTQTTTKTNKSSSPPTLLYLSFNQDSSCFAAGTTSGFRVYSCDPFVENYRRDLSSSSDPNAGGGIGLVQMLFKCNYHALVGGGPNPQFPLNKVMIWEDQKVRCVGELSFRSDVMSVRLRRDNIVVVLLEKIIVYNFLNFKPLHHIQTVDNPKGLCEISYDSESLVLVCPGLHKGQVRVEHYSLKKTKFIKAHESRVACFALTVDGNLLATASTKGTLVRIFNTVDGSLLQEVRRGADRADIHSLAFSPTAQWLAVSSDKGTVHIFSIKADLGPLGTDRASESDDSANNAVSTLSFIKGVLPKYFSSEWSVAQFRLPEGLECTVAFGYKKNSVIIIGMDGSFYRCEFDPVVGGDMTLLEHHNFLTPEHSADYLQI